MEIFLDTANLDSISEWMSMGVIDGVTTNPSIMRKDGVTDFEERGKAISRMIEPLPLSLEVTFDDLIMMLHQAKQYAEWGTNIVVKIPQITRNGQPCYSVIRDLEFAHNIRVNATVALSMSQLIFSAKAGATYISLFYGRITDEGGDANAVIRDSLEWLNRWKYKSKIISGSIRSVGDALSSAKAGAHIITVPPEILAKMADHKYTRDTVRQFIDDAEKATKEIEE